MDRWGEPLAISLTLQYFLGGGEELGKESEFDSVVEGEVDSSAKEEGFYGAGVVGLGKKGCKLIEENRKRLEKGYLVKDCVLKVEKDLWKGEPKLERVRLTVDHEGRKLKRWVYGYARISVEIGLRWTEEHLIWGNLAGQQFIVRMRESWDDYWFKGYVLFEGKLRNHGIMIGLRDMCQLRES